LHALKNVPKRHLLHRHAQHFSLAGDSRFDSLDLLLDHCDVARKIFIAEEALVIRAASLDFLKGFQLGLIIFEQGTQGTEADD
jgi:hypothetical protein